MKYSEMTKEQLTEERKLLSEKLSKYEKAGLSLDLSRGKPSKAQLDLSKALFDVFSADSDLSVEEKIDVRNYGGLSGIAEARTILSWLMGTAAENIIVFGESSLNVMYDVVSKAMTHGVLGSTPWMKLDKVKFLCPVPGYDRHFAITEHFGVEMINIPINEDGPDMDLVEKYVSQDASVKGIWCVPKFGNPAGIVFSEECVRRFANLKPAAKDFRIFWDNAYAIHYLDMNDQPQIPDIVSECEKAGNPDLVYMFGSFSKITFPGASISGLATSKNNRDDILDAMFYQTINHNKIAQLAHARFFDTKEKLMAHMGKHAEIMKPKFDLIIDTFRRDLSELQIAEWTEPKGGYFISFKTLPGLAKKVVAEMQRLGVKMTGAGAPFPYKNDPEDSYIRIAPSFASLDEIKTAIEVFSAVVRKFSLEQYLEK